MLPPVLLRSGHLPPLHLMQKGFFFPFLPTPWASFGRVGSHQAAAGRGRAGLGGTGRKNPWEVFSRSQHKPGVRKSPPYSARGTFSYGPEIVQTWSNLGW